MDNRNQRIVEALLGAVVLIVCAGFFAFAYMQGNKSIQKGYQLIARFDHADGLLIGSDVRVSGVKVGEVRNMTLDQESYLAIVTFDIQPSMRIPDDSAAHIVGDGLLGGKFLSIIPGESRDFLKAGQEITPTQSSVSLEALLSQFLFSSGSRAGSK